MSVQATTWVWNHSKAQGIDRLVLLALADHAHPDGSHAYPSVATLAEMTTVSERTVQRSLRHLTDLGEITVVTHARHHATTEYKIHVWGDSLTPQDCSGVTTTSPGVTETVFRGDTAMSPKPNNPGTQARARARTAPRAASEDVPDLIASMRQGLKTAGNG